MDSKAGLDAETKWEMRALVEIRTSVVRIISQQNVSTLRQGSY
jgi:hypothetical protein